LASLSFMLTCSVFGEGSCEGEIVRKGHRTYVGYQRYVVASSSKFKYIIKKENCTGIFCLPMPRPSKLERRTWCKKKGMGRRGGLCNLLPANSQEGRGGRERERGGERERGREGGDEEGHTPRQLAAGTRLVIGSPKCSPPLRSAPSPRHPALNC
jgi:hypothetical protein